MRTIRLLATTLLVALSMGVSSCGDDELEVNPPLNKLLDISKQQKELKDL